MAGDPKDTGQAGAGDTEAGRVQALDDRFGKIEAEQQRQGGILATIADKLGTTEGKAHDAAQQHTEDRLERPDTIAAMVKKAVQDVGAEAEAERQRQDHDAEHQRIREGREKQEVPPRPAGPSWKAKWQAAMFGKGPS